MEEEVGHAHGEPVCLDWTSHDAEGGYWRAIAVAKCSGCYLYLYVCIDGDDEKSVLLRLPELRQMVLDEYRKSSLRMGDSDGEIATLENP